MGVLTRPPAEESPETEDADDSYGASHSSNSVISNLNNQQYAGMGSRSTVNSIPRFYVGLQLDVKDTAGVWSEAEIMKVDYDQELFFVTFIYWGDRWDEWISMTDQSRYADLHTHTYFEGHNPGSKLKLGQRIEVKDPYAKWLEAFVIDITANEIKAHYKGYHPKFDEWLDRSSDRIRSFGRHKKLDNKQVVKMRRWQVPGAPGSGNTTGDVHDLTCRDNGSSEYARDRTRYYQHQDSLEGQGQIKVGDGEQTEINNYTLYLVALARRGLCVQPMDGDGNCLFRSVSHQLYGTDSFHALVREKCMDYMAANATFFSQFVVGGTTSFHLYVAAKRRDGVWGDDPEIQAMCEMYNLPSEIWAFDVRNGARKLRTFHENMGNSSEPDRVIRLSYYGGGHYDSVVIASPLGPATVRGGSTCTESHRGILPGTPGVAEDAVIRRCEVLAERERRGLVEAQSRSQEIEQVQRHQDELASAVLASREQSEQGDIQRAEEEIVNQVLEESRRALMRHLCFDDGALGADEATGENSASGLPSAAADIEQQFLLWCAQSEEQQRQQKLQRTGSGSTADAKTSASSSSSSASSGEGSVKESGAEYKRRLSLTDASVKDADVRKDVQLSAVSQAKEDISSSSNSASSSIYCADSQAKATGGTSDIEGELMAAVLRSSEQEFLELQYREAQQQKEQEQEDLDLRLALEMSHGGYDDMQDYDNDEEDTKRAIQESMRAFNAGADAGVSTVGALAAGAGAGSFSSSSAASSSSSSNSTNAAHGNFNIGSQGLSADEDYDADLYLAIQASLK